MANGWCFVEFTDVAWVKWIQALSFGWVFSGCGARQGEGRVVKGLSAVLL